MKSFSALIFGLVFVLAHVAPAAANEETDARMKKVLQLFLERPIERQPVTEHPVRKGRPFSRHFNISRSARAYLQLMTDPSLDASSSALLGEVGQYYLDHLDQIDDPDSSYWAGEYHAAALARFGKNGTHRKGAIAREDEVKVLEYMVDFLNHWSRLEFYDFSIQYDTYYYWSTENHWWQEIVTSWGYLLILKNDPEFKDTILDDGKTLYQHYDATTFYMKEHMRQRSRKGFFLEISSGGYAGRMHNMYHLIYSISPDDDLKALAEKTLNLWWAFWVEEQIMGERGGGKVRHRRLRGLKPDSENHMTPGWYYFGVGPRDLKYLRNTKSSRSFAADIIGILSDYRPAPIIYKILEDREVAPPFAITQRRVGKSAGQAEHLPEIIKKLTEKEFGWEGIPKHKFYDLNNSSVLKYSWVSPNFILGTNIRPPIEVQNWVAGSAQGWWHGLLMNSRAGGFPDRVVPTLIYPSDAMGEQYAVQSKGALMARKLPDAWSRSRDNNKFPMGVFVSKSLERRTRVQGEFLFINSPTTWVAVRAVDTEFLPSQDDLTKGQQAAGTFYRLLDDTKPVIIEAAEHVDYKNFNDFRRKVELAELTYADGTVTYTTLANDKLTMFDDRSTPMINGEIVNYTPSVAYDSRYIFSTWDSGVITIKVGGEEYALDFTIH